jgi:hypothetical protein
MADIDVVPKRRSSLMWLWIVIAIVVIVALWFGLRGGGTSPARTGRLAVPPVPMVTAAVATLT